MKLALLSKLFLCLHLFLTNTFIKLYASTVEPTDKKSYTSSRIISSAPKIDGVFNDESWGSVEWESSFVQLSPYENKPPTAQTSFKVMYDDNNLYVAIKAHDPSPDSIVRRMSRRDSYTGDRVEIAFDSYLDKRTGFAFGVNVAGVKNDGAISNDNNYDKNWDPIWYVKTSIDSEGWNAEMQIPLTQLRFSKKDSYIWGIQISRVLFRNQEKSSWQFISPKAAGYVSHFGELNGINNIVPKKQRDITPYMVGKLNNYQQDHGNPFSTGRDFSGNVGLDGKFGITNNLTLDFSVNPDFGQVEADPSEVNLSAFETYFSEKRAFFIEAKEKLSHQIITGGPMQKDNLFYSRRIGRRPQHSPDLGDNEYGKAPNNTTILGAVKLTGKTPKGWSVGLMESITQREFMLVNYENERRNIEIEPLTNYTAAKVEKDFNNSNSQFGAMVTSTNRNISTPEVASQLHKSAYSGGLSFSHQWKDKTYFLDVNMVYSNVQGTKDAILKTQTSSPHFFQRPDAGYIKLDSNRTSLDGMGGSFVIGKQGNGKLRYLNWVTWRSPGLNLNDMGYQRLTDNIQQVLWVGYFQNEPFSIFREAYLNFNQWSGHSFGGDMLYYGGNINGGLEFKNHWGVETGFSREGKALSTDALRGGPSIVIDAFTDYWFQFGTDRRKKVRVSGFQWFGLRDEKVDFNSNTGLNVDIQVSNSFKVSIKPVYRLRDDKIAYVKSLDNIEPKRYIRGNLKQKTTSLSFRLSYSLTPDFSIQYYAMPFISAGKYDNFKYVLDPGVKEFSGRYKVFSETQISVMGTGGDKVYEIDEDVDGSVDYSFDNPNFNVMDFNSNLVLRWEYLPGSTLFVVWNQNRHSSLSRGSYSFPNDPKHLFTDTYPNDIFLVKFSYRLAI